MGENDKIEWPNCGQMVPESEFDEVMQECTDCISEQDFAATI